MADFEDILSKPVEEIEKPKPRPAGTYMGVIQGMPSRREFPDKSGGENFKVLDFKIKLQSAGPDVSADALEEHNPIHEWPPQTHTIFYATPEGQYALKEFLVNVLGIDASGGRSFAEMLPEAAGKMLNVTLQQEPFMDKSGQPQIASRIRGVAAI